MKRLPDSFFHLTLLLGVAFGGCSPARSPSATNRSPEAQKWLDRAKASYASGDMDDAWDAARGAVRAAPTDVEAELCAARVALARLDYDETIRILKGVPGSDARGLRGRAEWYAGRIEAAADELEAMLQDPDVRDGWAKAIAGLARRGAGRKPFRMSGGAISASEMARLPGSPAMIVPLEIDGEEGLAMIATGSAEVALDSATRKEPAWISLRFGHRIEIKDVPAVVQDLSAVSRRMNAPIKALLGINLLRHLNVTFDYSGGQFVVRSFAPPVPPQATRIPVYYVKGGGMMIKSTLQASKAAPPAVLMVDTAMSFPLALDQDGWKKAGVSMTSLVPLPEDPKLKRGTVPVLRLGAFDIPEVVGLFGPSVEEVEKGVQVDLDGVLGAGTLAMFRITLADEGRAMWMEDLPMPPGMTPPRASAPARPAQQSPLPSATLGTSSSSSPPASSAPKPSERPSKPARTPPKKDPTPE